MSAPLDEAREVAQLLLRRLQSWQLIIARGEIAGSIRRGKPEVKDIELLVVPATVPDGFMGDTRLALEEIREEAETWGHVSKGGERYIRVDNALASGLDVDLFLCHPPATWGALLAIRTGPAAYSEMLVTKIKGRGWRCVDGHVVDDLGRLVPTDTEEQFHAAARMPMRSPDQRHYSR